MGKVFNIHNEAKGNIAHWQTSSAYDSKVIEEIADPEGATVKKEITSIPSPFARIDVVKTAFAEVVKSKDLDGGTIYHKMVSDTLDIAELFFNISKFSSKFDIIPWDTHDSIETLLKGSEGHRKVGETLKMFLDQDGKDYHFDQASTVYLLRYKGIWMKKQGGDIVGATSPATLFFSSANNLEYIAQDVSFDGNDKPFDKELQPLYKRDFEFVKYLFALKSGYPVFTSTFKEVTAYLELTFAKLDSTQKQDINALTPSDLSAYSPITFGSNTVSILDDLQFHMRPVKPIVSDFEIKPSVQVGSPLPLVLPTETGNTYTNMTYTYAKWDKSSHAPYSVDTPIQDRVLPNEGSKHPYITISDLLEDNIIKLDYRLNTNAFFDGNFGLNALGNSKAGFLLPVKDRLFDYFTADDLMGKMPDGKHMIDLEPLVNAVKVTLRIPVKGKGSISYITYSRTYFENNAPDIEKNEGGIVKEDDLLMALLPCAKFDNDDEAFYRFATIGDFNKNYSANFYFNNKSLGIVPCSVRNQNCQDIARTAVSIIENNRITHCRISDGNIGGLLLTRLARHSGSDAFTFAIDLGTTNTYVSYTVNNGAIETLNITENDSQIVYTDTQSNDYMQAYVTQDLMPQTIGTGDKFSFPTRTVLSEGNDTDWNVANYPLGNTSIDFTYGKQQTNSYNKVTTDIKWAGEDIAVAKLRSFVENLMIIIRNKVTLCNGNLALTRVVWTYPISMTNNKYGQLSRLCQEAFAKYINPDTRNLIPMTESCAPYEYYRKENGAVNRIVTIDIGGGSSDAVFAQDGQVVCITSFRFAANSLFGAGYNGVNGALNGIITKYRDNIANVLEANSLGNLEKVLEEIERSRKSSEINAFFFSLADNAEVKGKNVSKQLDYNDMLSRDGNFKIVVLIFYAAIIFHIAKIMKAKNLEFPRHIAFSGNGSKAISILTSDKSTLEDLTRLIFEKVHGKTLDGDFDIIFKQKDPKEMTCKGALSFVKTDSNAVKGQDYRSVSAKKVVYNANGLLFTNEKYKDFSDKLVDQVVEELEDFFMTIFDINASFSFKDNFGVEDEALNIAKQMAMKDARTYIRKGKEAKNVADTDDIEETLFFNHLNGILFEMIANIVK